MHEASQRVWSMPIAVSVSYLFGFQKAFLFPVIGMLHPAWQPKCERLKKKNPAEAGFLDTVNS